MPEKADTVTVSAAAAASLQLLARAPAARTLAGARAAEAWLRVSLASGVSNGLGEECLSLVDAAEAARTDAMPLLNLTWRLAKALCLHSCCNLSTVHTALLFSARGAAAQLIMASGSGDGGSLGSADDALFVATFHCSNFLRIARDAPLLRSSLREGDDCDDSGRSARDGHPFPLRAVAETLKPAVVALAAESVTASGRRRSSEGGGGDSGTIATAASAVRARSLLDKVVSAALECWVGSLSSLDDKYADDDLGRLLQDTATSELLLANSILLLASGRFPDRGTQSFLTEVVLRAAEERHQLGAAEVDAFAIVCATGVPGARPRLLAWTISPDPRLYCLALRLHRAMPRWQASSRATAWAQLLFEGLVMNRRGACGSNIAGGSLGRAQLQAASCIAVLLSQCPPAVAAAWARGALAALGRTVPAVAQGKGCGDGSGEAALWALARR